MLALGETQCCGLARSVVSSSGAENCALTSRVVRKNQSEFRVLIGPRTYVVRGPRVFLGCFYDFQIRYSVRVLDFVLETWGNVGLLKRLNH